jgi:hypothetical protein
MTWAKSLLGWPISRLQRVSTSKLPILSCLSTSLLLAVQLLLWLLCPLPWWSPMPLLPILVLLGVLFCCCPAALLHLTLCQPAGPPIRLGRSSHPTGLKPYLLGLLIWPLLRRLVDGTFYHHINATNVQYDLSNHSTSTVMSYWVDKLGHCVQDWPHDST